MSGTKKKKYRVKITPERLKTIRAYWKLLEEYQSELDMRIVQLEVGMAKDTKIKGIEFIRDEMCGGGWIGVGNINRTMGLLQGEELE